MHPIACCYVSAAFSGLSILFAKSIAELIRRTLLGESQLGLWQSYILVIAMVLSVTMQLNFLASALVYFDVLFVVPVFQCCFLVVTTLGGASYFNELHCFTTLQWVMFPLGISLTLAGVALISSREGYLVMRAAEPESPQVMDMSEMEGIDAEQAERLNSFRRKQSHSVERVYSGIVHVNPLSSQGLQIVTMQADLSLLPDGSKPNAL